MLKIWTVLSRAATVVLALLLRVEAALTTEHTINNNQLQSLRFDDGEGSDSMDVRWIHPNQPAANSFVGERRDAYERAPDTSIPPVGQDFDMRLKGIFTRLLVWPAQALGAAVALPLRMGSNRKVWQGRGSLMALPARGSRLGFPLLLFALLLGAAAPALAGTDFCSDYKKSPEDTYAIIDGNDPFVQANLPSSSFGIDINCEFRNFPISAIWPNGLEPTLNFYTPNKTEVYLVVFDNVWYSGNLACSNIDHKLWVVNSDEGSFGGTCQDIMIPAETIAKQAPAATATIGVPFTYTLTLPSMNWPVGDPSANDLHTVILWDDLTAAGADLTYVDINAYYKGSGAPVTLVPEDQPQPTSKGGVWTTKNLSYKPIPLITTGEQIVVEITVVLDDTPTNVTGTVITNTAKWWFGRLIDIDGVPTFFDPLPGEWGVSQPMTIAEPNLVVTKSGSETALNLGIPATFTIDLQNTGGSDAWNATILDQLPDGPTAGMCDYDPTSGAISAQIFAADGVTPVAGPLLQGTAYSVTYDAPTCQLSFSMLTSAAVIGPSQRLIITYQSELDAGTTGEGLAMVNLAGATQWSSADGSHPTRTYTRTLTDGTPAIIDHEDSYTITTALSGYYFQKTVANLTTAANPATGAAPGDRLRYRLRLFNVDQTIDNITIDDTLDPANFDTSTFSIVTLPAGSTYSFDPVTGLLEISGNPPPLNIAVGGELVIEFEIDLAAGLTNGIVVPNQATLTATGLPPAEIPVFSDDPFINSIAPPGTVGDPTNVLIQTPGPLSKTNTQPSAMIGEQFKYRITLPAAPLDVALYDVRILDDLIPSNADMRFINANVVSGGSWTLSNTGTDTSPVIEDTATGIDIPANGQAVIEITVELLNTTANQSGVLFNNSASYTYNRSNGVIATETSGEAGSTNVDMIVVEPDLTVAKVGTLITAAPVSGGSIIEYAITMTNGGNATAYDVNIVDTLPPELALYGTFTPTASIDGIPVVGFVTAPTDAPAGPLLWGQGNGDGNLDIPAGSTLILTYQAQVQISAAATFNNDVSVDWTSLDAASTYERTGAGCPTFTAPDDYCATAISAPISIIDNNSLTKAVVADSWITDGSTALDATVRIGDTATYQLTLNLGEGTTSSVEITDVLDPGLEFVEVVSINGDVTAPYSSVAPFSYTDFPAPTILGDVTTGTTMTWTLGDVYNTPDGDNTNNSFVIEYRVRVAENVLAQAGTTTLTNTATLGYVDGSGNAVVDPVRLESNATLTLLQPDLTVSKSVATAGGDLIIGAGELITYTVDVINNGLAPAYDTVVEDVIPAGLRDGAATITMVSTELLIGGALTNLAPAYDPLTGIAIWNFDTGTANQYTIPAADTLRIVYTVQADPVLGPGLPLTNAAIATLYYSFDDEAIPVNSIVTDHEVYGPSNTAQTTLTTAPGAPLKVNPADTTVTIGQEFTYAITVPEAAQPTALYDVRVLDDLGAIAADLTFVGISKISPAGTWVPTNSGTASNLIIEDTTNGIDIPANEQIVIGVTVRLDKSAINIDGLPFSNSASYTYNQVDGDDVTQLGGGSSVTTDMTVVEPDLIITKVGTPIPAGPITGGSIIEYAVTMVNSGNDTAYDVNIVDTLPPELALYGTFTPTATIDGIPVVGFVTAPTDAPAGPLLWGRGNGDGNLDIPAGSTLILTYQAQVQVSTVATFDNTVWVDWTSLDAASTHERTGAGCPTITAPDDYCATATSAPFSIIDNNSLNKAVIADSYVDAFSTALDATVRIGDTATYQLTLNLGEGTTNSVTVSDLLPAGMAFDSLVGITPSAGGNFTYTLTTQPAAGATGTLVWDFGTITNTANGTPIDALVIEYIATVLPDAGITQVSSTTLTNTATLGYSDGTGTPVVDPTRLVDTVDIMLWQPLMSAVTKTGNGLTNTAAAPLNVTVATDTVHFQLESCNTAAPAAPAYSVLLSDVLATQLDESSIVGPTVNINGAPATAGADYNYIAPAVRGGTLQVELLTPVNPGQCVTVDYDIGFYTDFGPNEVWNNSVTLDEYWSLPLKSGQQYLPLVPAQFFMTNLFGVEPLSKSVFSPVSGEVTIGEEAVYTITVPSIAVNAALDNVVVSDTLHAALEYNGASAVDGSGSAVALTESVAGQDVNLTIAQIPANEQVIITLRTQVANNAAANAGTSFTNTAAYTYSGIPAAAVTGGISGPLLIVEPTVAIAKTVAPLTPPNAGDILQYSLTFTAGGGANFSDAFDLRIDDSLSLGLAYQIGTATVNGAGNTIANPVVTGDGITTPQTLLWRLEDTTADIDIVEGTTVTVTYDVVVLDSVLAGQALTNSASAQWTGLDTINALERTGTGTPVENDYFTGPVTTILTTSDTTTLTKTRLSDTYNAADANVRIGDLVDFELRLHLDEGSHSGLVLSDVLPQGLQFEQVVSINGDALAPYSAVAPFTHSDITAPGIIGDATTGPTTVTWTLGDVVNVGDNNAANDEFVIIYRTRLLNNDVFAQVNSTPLTNTATLDYTIATGPASRIDIESVTLLQPNLTVSKTAAPAGGDTIIDSSELITYTVDITNTGAAPAYDTVLQDIIPIGLRNGAATITMVSNSLLIAGSTPPNITPVYDPLTGIATWNFDSGVADQYAIPAGDTLRVIYQLQADATLSAGMTLTNQAQALVYYSFDAAAVPSLGTVSGVSQIYGPTNIAGTTLTTTGPNPLSKQNPAILTVAVGDTFSYRITVPAIPMTTALNDVRILDDLAASAADLGFVSATRVSGSQPWTPVNTGTASNLIIEDTLNGIDIPAGEQVVIDITVVVNDSPVNVSGLLFNNTASYTYNQVNDDLTTQFPGGGETTADMTIAGPDSVTMNKTGPAQINPGIAEVFTLNAHNTGTAPAWDLTITDVLPNPAPGGMCDTPPANITAQIFQADGVTAVSGVLLLGTDYNATYAPDPACTLTITMTSAAGALPADNRLIVTYEALLDSDNPQGTVLTNVAGATEWFSGDTAGAGATGAIRTYTRTLTDGTVATLDHEDAHSIIAQSAIIQFQKTAVNVTTGENPATTATPGDVLRYSILLSNVSPVPLPDFAITDEVDRLNALGMFAPGSLAVVTIPAGADASNTNPNGGSKATGLLDVGSLNLDAAGGANDTLLIEFEVTLAPVITSGTVVLNQAQLTTIVTGTLNSDDPNINGVDDPAVLGDEDPTPITIVSAPVLEVLKTSEDLTGDPAILVAGDTLRYTITVKNIGTEDAIKALLRDQIPTNTSYVANSTILNGIVVTDPPPGGVSALQAGMKINAPENTTLGYMRADPDSVANNVATITFDVVVDASAINGTVISNQGFVSGDGQGSGPFTEVPSDDPGTATINDPTVDVVGSLPLVDAQKTVTLQVDNGTLGIVDPGDTLRYTITITNTGATPATGVIFTDATPANTTYKDNSVQLNGMPVGQPDGGVSPLIAGIDVSTSDLTPPLPAAGAGTLTPGQTAVVTFDVQVNGGVVPTTIISNQGVVSSNEQANEPTDADGIDANGDQPTQIVVGDAQLLSITKDVFVVGGGVALAGGQLEYVVRVTNISTVPANNVVITDNLDIPVAGQVTYVDFSATLNGLAIGVAAPVITADYSTTYGDLQPGEVIELRFRVQIGSAVAIGTTITNTGIVNWNSPAQTASASVSLDVGGTPGTATLNGNVWHDAGLDLVFDSSEQLLENWSVALYRNNLLLGTVLTAANGTYQLSGLAPNLGTTDLYELRFRAPGAGPNTASLGYSDSVFTNGPQRISDIIVDSGNNLQNLNLPIWPNGTVYNSVARVAVAGAELALLNAATGAPLPIQCFDDPTQQNQLTAQNGFYKFDLNFSDASCQPGGTYYIEVTPPATGYVATPSQIIPPNGEPTDPFSVLACPGSVDDAVPATTEYCEAVASASVPPLSVLPRTAGTIYHLHLVLSDGTVPGQSQIFNNPIPIDPELNGAVAISKTSSMINVSKGALVPYTIIVTNVYGAPLSDISIIDRFPAGFKYVAGSARLDGNPTEPQVNGRELVWDGLQLQVNDKRTIQLLLVVGSGVSEGEYVNRAQVFNTAIGTVASGEATATVQVVPDPDFDCTDVIGKVFDDRNLNGRQDPGDNGLANARVVTARGLIATTDKNGRFHITCAAVPDSDRGSNFILKLDERSLPTGYRLTSENPRVQRATRGKMMRFNFGATIHRVVRIDIADGVFEPNSSDLRLQWKPKISQLIEELKKAPSVLRLSYLADVERQGLVRKRLDALKKEITSQWDRWDGGYRLTVETEVFWRRGAPLKGRK